MADIQAFLDRVLTGGLQRTNRYRCKLNLGAATGESLRNLGISEPGLEEAVTLLREGLLCRTTMTPSRTFETTTVNLAGGYEETYAVGTTYNNLDCTFLCPLIPRESDPGDPEALSTNPVLSLFHAWQNLIQNRGKTGEDADMVLSFPREYRLEQGMRLELFGGNISQEAQTANREHDYLRSLGHDFSAINFKGRASGRPRITTAFEYFDVYPVTVSGTTVDWATMEEMMEVAVSFSYTHWQQVKDGDLNL